MLNAGMKYNLTWLKQKYDGGSQPEFLFFFAAAPSERSGSGEETMLTQWYPSNFVVQGDQYLHSAHWMMVQKAKLFDDIGAANRLLAATDDRQILEHGRQIAGFDQKHWDDHKYNIVMLGNLHKFSQNQSLRAYISGTHPRVLAEANPNDQIWGIGLTEGTDGAMNPHHWRGLNLLGFALMEVRDNLGGFMETISSVA
jgi:ribA/ribD-fused uncharacterized protein